MSSQIRQNFPAEIEAALNKLANLEFHVSYVYLAMSYHFDRDDVALNGFHKLFVENSKSEHNGAEQILSYQLLRGGRIALQDIGKPPANEWGTGLEALITALELEKRVNQVVLDVHSLADERGDKETCDWLEDKFLQAKVESIKKLSEHITNLKRVGPSQGEYLFERETLH